MKSKDFVGVFCGRRGNLAMLPRLVSNLSILLPQAPECSTK
jgi:hypothetical protein